MKQVEKPAQKLRRMTITVCHCEVDGKCPRQIRPSTAVRPRWTGWTGRRIPIENFPLMQKGNLRNKFIWFPFATMSSKACCKTRHHCKKQTRNQSLFEHEMRTWFCSALHGLDTRCDIQEPGKVSFLKVCCAFALHTRFGYWKLSKSRASLICFRRLR